MTYYDCLIVIILSFYKKIVILLVVILTQLGRILVRSVRGEVFKAQLDQQLISLQILKDKPVVFASAIDNIKKYDW